MSSELQAMFAERVKNHSHTRSHPRTGQTLISMPDNRQGCTRSVLTPPDTAGELSSTSDSRLTHAWMDNTEASFVRVKHVQKVALAQAAQARWTGDRQDQSRGRVTNHEGQLIHAVPLTVVQRT